MNSNKIEVRSTGFAIIEALLIMVIVVSVVVVGAYVLHQKHKADNTLSKASTITSTTSTEPKANGTTASVNQLTQQDAQTEAGADNAADSQAQQASTSSNSAVSNAGGAYNENNL